MPNFWIFFNKKTVISKLQVYIAKEDNDCCTRNCCGACRPFDMKVMDLYSNEIIHFYRPLRCTGCCYPCCMQSIEIASPPGEIIGHVKEEWTCWFPNFKIQNHLGDTVLRIEGPCCTWSCCSDIDFKVTNLNWEFRRIFNSFSIFTDCRLERQWNWENIEEMVWNGTGIFHRFRQFWC